MWSTKASPRYFSRRLKPPPSLFRRIAHVERYFGNERVQDSDRLCKTILYYREPPYLNVWNQTI
jgi:hypothetical protein